MTAFRILSQSPVYFLLDGVTPAAGGRIEFYEAGTTTAKDVYGDKALTVNNGSSVDLGSDGRAAVDVWGSGSYRVRVYAADDTIISDDDNVELPGGTGTSIPSLSSGKFLTNDGAVLQWDTVLQPPDPTGQSGKYLGSDGANIIWQSGPTAPTVPTLPTDGITASSGKVTIGNILIQWGTGTAPASGAHTTNKSVSFGTAYASTPVVFVNTKTQPMTSSGFMGTCAANGISTTGFNAGFDINVDNSGSAWNIIGSLDFCWMAVGEGV